MFLFWKKKIELLFRYLSIVPFLMILLFARMNWSGGWSYGQRYFGDVTPILSLSLFPVFQPADRRKYVKWLLGVLAAVSISMHAIGALGYDTS
jgi:hypothetical protein